MKTSIDPCVCGSGIETTACCARLHAGEAAADAETLMRSRYAAFVLRNERYLIDTWHSTTRPKAVPFVSEQKWLGLRVLQSTLTSETTAEVEFMARYRIGGASATKLHERSRFVLENGRWFYVDGDTR